MAEAVSFVLRNAPDEHLKRGSDPNILFLFNCRPIKTELFRSLSAFNLIFSFVIFNQSQNAL